MNVIVVIINGIRRIYENATLVMEDCNEGYSTPSRTKWEFVAQCVAVGQFCIDADMRR